MAAAGSGVSQKKGPSKQTSKYVLVNESDDETSKDVKDPLNTTLMPNSVKDGEGKDATKLSDAMAFKRLGDMMKAGSGFGKAGVYKLRIVLANQSTSAAAAAGAAVYAIEPTNSSEMTSLSSLFSEFRVKPEVHFMYNIGYSGAPNQQMAVVAYDPVEGTALTSVSNGLQSSQWQLTGFGPVGITFPSAVTVDGYRKFTVKLLSGVVTNGSVTGLAAANQWLPLNSTGGKFGYIRYYVPNGPAGVTNTVQSYMLVDVEFRNRV